LKVLRKGKINHEDTKILVFDLFSASYSSERQDKPGRSNILKGGYLVNCPFDKEPSKREQE